MAWVCFLLGFMIGLYCNSDVGAKHGYAAGKFTRENILRLPTIEKDHR